MTVSNHKIKWNRIAALKGSVAHDLQWRRRIPFPRFSQSFIYVQLTWPQITWHSQSTRQTVLCNTATTSIRKLRHGSARHRTNNARL